MRRLLASVVESVFHAGDIPQAHSTRFSDDLSASISLDAFTLDSLSGNAPLPRSGMSLNWDATSTTANVQLTTNHAGILDNGWYDAIWSQVALPLDAEHRHAFRWVLGDLNNDGAVSNQDISLFLELLNGAPPAGTGPAYGDMNRDGVVNNQDISPFIAALTSIYSTRMPDPLAAPGQIVTWALSSTSIRINWTPPLDGTPDGYRIYRSIDGTNFVEIAELESPEEQPGGFFWDDTGLEHGTKYWYRIRPFFDDPDLGRMNGHTTEKVWSCTVLPGVADVAVQPIDGSSARVSWVDQSDTETGFEVRRYDPASGQWSLLDTVGAGVTEVVLNSLPPNATLYLSVRSINVETHSASSEIAPTITPPAGAGMVVYQYELAVDQSTGLVVSSPGVTVEPNRSAKYIGVKHVGWMEPEQEFSATLTNLPAHDWATVGFSTQAWAYNPIGGGSTPPTPLTPPTTVQTWVDSTRVQHRVQAFVQDGSATPGFLGSVLHKEPTLTVRSRIDAATPARDEDRYVVTDLVVTLYSGQVARLTAHRTGGRLGEVVTEELENEADPSKYLILTNNDREQGLPEDARDFEDDAAAIPGLGGSGGLDDDLARVTLHQLPAGLDLGLVDLTLSNAESVRLFKADGSPLLSSELSADLSGDGYLAGVKDGDVEVWFEGLRADADFVLNFAYRSPSGSIVGEDSVHVLIAEWQMLDHEGVVVDGTSNVTKAGLLAAVNGTESDVRLRDSQLFRLRVAGAPPSVFAGLRVQSDEVPGDYYDDVLTEDGNAAVSSRHAVLYYSEDGQPLSSYERSQVLTSLDLNAVHNQSATATATTQAGDQQSRKVAIAPRQLLLDRLKDEEDKHRNAAYYTTTHLDTLFPRLRTIAASSFFKVTIKTKSQLGEATATYEKNGVFSFSREMCVRADLGSLTAVHETIHALNDQRKIHDGNSDEDVKADEAIAWGIERLLSKTSLFRDMERAQGQADAWLAVESWNKAWRSTPPGYPNLTAGPPSGEIFGWGSGKTASFRGEDFWDIHHHYGIRFSAGHLRPVYENVLAANGVTNTDGSRVFLPATTIPAGSYFA